MWVEGMKTPELGAVLLEFKCNIYWNSVYTAIHYIVSLFTMCYVNTFAASYLNTQGLNNSCLKSRQLRP